MKKIAVLTSGGDAPGMNACIRAVVRMAIYHELKIYGIERGYQGMVDGIIFPMHSRSVSNIIQRGGTVIKTARCKDFETPDGRRLAFENIREKEIDGIIAIGGNGTYTGAAIFYEEFGIPIVGLPGTIDNDLYGTDYTIGFDTAINTALEAIDRIRDTADSNDRTFFIEVMGRDAGYIALDVGLGGGAEAILVPELHTDLNLLAETLKKGWGSKKRSQLVVVAEGDDAGGVFKIVDKLKEIIPALEARTIVLGHIQRGGSPSAKDRVLASRLGAAAVQALMDHKTNVAIGIVNEKLHYVPLKDAVEKKKPVNRDLIKLATILSA